MDFDYEVIFALKDEMSRKVRRINSVVTGLGNEVKEVVNSIQRSFNRFNVLSFNKKIDFVRKRLEGIRKSSKELLHKGISQTIGGVATTVAGLVPLNVAKDYEAAFVKVRKSVSGTTGEINNLYSQAKMIAAKTGKPFEEVTEVFEAMGKASLKAVDIPAISQSIIKGALALGVDASTTIKEITSLIAKTGQEEKMKEASIEIMDLMAHLENKVLPIAFSDLSYVWSKMAPGLKILKLTNQESGALAATLTKLGESRETSGTSLNRLAQRLRQIDIETGTNFIDTIQKQGLGGLMEVVKSMAKDKDMAQISSDLGLEAMKTFEILLSKSGSLDLTKHLGFTTEARGAVEKEFELYISTLSAKMSKAKAILVNLGAAIGAPLLELTHSLIDFIKPLASWIIDFTKSNRVAIGYIAGLVAVLGGFVAILGGIKIAIAAVGFALGTIAPLFKVFLASWVLLKGILVWFFGFAKIIFAFLKVQMLTNPFFWKWALIAGAIALVAWGLYELFKWINSFIEWGAVLDWIKENWVNLLSVIFPVFGFFRLLFIGLKKLYEWGKKTKLWGKIADWIMGKWKALKTFSSQ